MELAGLQKDAIDLCAATARRSNHVVKNRAMTKFVIDPNSAGIK
jgi:hypothetical protein